MKAMRTGNENYTLERHERRTRQCMARWSAIIEKDIIAVAAKCMCFRDSDDVVRIKINRTTQVLVTICDINVPPRRMNFKYRWQGHFMTLNSEGDYSQFMKLYWQLYDLGRIPRVITIQ